MEWSRWITVGLAALLGAACSRTQPPSPAEGAVATVPPEPESPIEETLPELAPESVLLPAGPVVSAATLAAHEVAQAQLLRDKGRLPDLRPASEVRPPILATPVGLSREVEALDRVVSLLEAVHGPMPGYFVPVADPVQSRAESRAEGAALAHFHQALRALAQGRDPDGKVRVAMYGASGTAADISVGYLRTYLQARFGDGGPGFVPLVPLSKWYRHNEVVVTASKGWRKEHAQIASGRQDGHYGLLGASFSATAPRRWGEVRPKKHSVSAAGIAHVELLFLRQPGGGTFRVQVDQGPAEVVSTAGEAIEPGYHALHVEPGPHAVRIETQSEAEVRIFGVVLERDEPGVVVDVLGINGTRGRNHLTWNESLWADNLRHRAPDLYTLSYGTNESVDEELSIPLYAEDLRAQLRRFARALPEASCVLLGPVDFPIVADGQVMPRPVLRQIIDVQRQVAAEEGCGFWDGIAFMGGELSMPAWVHADPPLARHDHLHYTRWGGARKGMALADAFMHAFDARAAGAGSVVVTGP